MKAYWVNGNYDGRSCQDATVVFAEDEKDAGRKALTFDGFDNIWTIEEIDPKNFDVVEYPVNATTIRLVRGVWVNGCCYWPTNEEDWI